ncbi:MAG TPA: dihydroxy-acid dehydratase [Bryobacteraceae bacterium]|nr:dihydroxy-acid dehydratase [Bryobacteraceae bacterium]
MKKSIIGIANNWIETIPCNYSRRALPPHVKEGIRAAGGTPMVNTIAISDGVRMGIATSRQGGDIWRKHLIHPNRRTSPVVPPLL